MVSHNFINYLVWIWYFNHINCSLCLSSCLLFSTITPTLMLQSSANMCTVSHNWPDNMFDLCHVHFEMITLRLSVYLKSYSTHIENRTLKLMHECELFPISLWNVTDCSNSWIHGFNEWNIQQMASVKQITDLKVFKKKSEDEMNGICIL